jgi:hypothetical protein
MNSLPFISHHLFVAAVANEDRRQERPVSRERQFGGLAERVAIIPHERVDVREPMVEVAARASQARSFAST